MHKIKKTRDVVCHKEPDIREKQTVP